MLFGIGIRRSDRPADLHGRRPGKRMPQIQRQRARQQGHTHQKDRVEPPSHRTGFPILDDAGPPQGRHQRVAEESGKGDPGKRSHGRCQQHRAVGENIGRQGGKELEDEHVRGRSQPACEKIARQSVFIAPGEKPQVNEQTGDDIHQHHQHTVSVAGKELHRALEHPRHRARALLACKPHREHQPQDMHPGGPLQRAGHPHEGGEQPAGSGNIRTGDAAQCRQRGHHQQIARREIIAVCMHSSSNVATKNGILKRDAVAGRAHDLLRPQQTNLLSKDGRRSRFPLHPIGCTPSTQAFLGHATRRSISNGYKRATPHSLAQLVSLAN